MDGQFQFVSILWMVTFASKVLLAAFSWEISILVCLFVSDLEMQQTLLELHSL